MGRPRSVADAPASGDRPSPRDTEAGGASESGVVVATKDFAALNIDRLTIHYDESWLRDRRLSPRDLPAFSLVGGGDIENEAVFALATLCLAIGPDESAAAWPGLVALLAVVAQSRPHSVDERREGVSVPVFERVAA